MISYLSGTIHSKEKQALVVLVSGVGYKVQVPDALWSRCMTGATCALYTHLHIREDAWELYGFTEERDVEFFIMLLSVNGVGPKSALNIFNAGSINDMMSAVRRGDMAFLTKVSGIGRKTAERMVLELKHKVGDANVAEGSHGAGASGDVVEALVGMGYALADARVAVQSAGEGLPAGELLKKALAELKK